MNSDLLKGKWKQLKGSVKERWGKLTDDDLEVIAGRYDQLIGRVQERYGLVRMDAQKQVEQWNLAEPRGHQTQQERQVG